jgi:hypothetical protein
MSTTKSANASIQLILLFFRSTSKGLLLSETEATKLTALVKFPTSFSNICLLFCDKVSVHAEQEEMLPLGVCELLKAM